MVLGTSASPILAIAPTIDSVTVSETSIQIVYDQDVVSVVDSADDNYDQSAGNFDNYAFQIDGANYPLSRLAPYSNYTEYFNTTTAGTDGVLNIFGLNFTAGDPWGLNISGIATDTSPYDAVMTPDSNTGTVSASADPVIYKIENIEGSSNTCNDYPCGKAEEQIRITGTRFNTETSGIEITGLGTLVTVTASDADAFVITIPEDAPVGNAEIKIKNLDDNAYSNVKSFAVYDAENCGVIKGILTSTALADKNDVPVRLESWNTQYGSTKTHSNGYYAIVAYNSGCSLGSFDVFFTTKAGSGQATPTEIGSKAIVINEATDAGTKAFVDANFTGKITATSSTGDPVNGATVIVHNNSWSTNQQAITDADGNYKVYIPTTNASNYYGVEVQPPTYNPNSLQMIEEWITISQGVPNSVKNISLPALNVQGTLKTPTGASASNPNPNEPVPNANISIHNQDWSVNQWAITDSNGVFQFGVPAGSDYILEVQPPYGDDSFGGYSGRSYEGLTIGATLTNLDTDISGGPRLAVPNVFGRVYKDINSNSVYDAGGEKADGAWVSMWGPGFWAGMNTNSEGKFSFAVSDAGNYEINIDAPSSDYSNYSAEISVSSVEVSNGIGHDLEDVAFPTPNVTGQIFGPVASADKENGQSNISVDVCPYMMPGQCYWGQTDDTGAFGIGTVPDGSWEMRFNMWSNSSYAVPSTKILVVSGGSVTFVDNVSNASNTILNTIRMVDPAVNGLTGVVYGPTGTIGQSANLSLRQNTMSMMDMSEWANTNDSGEFVFGSVDAGTYELEVMPDWNSEYSRAMYTITIDTDGVVTSSDAGVSPSTNRTIAVKLTQPNITGTLKTPVYVAETHSGLGIDESEFNQPVSWGWISMHTQGPMMGPGGWYGGNTNEAGVFSFGGVQAGTYVIEYQAGWGSKFSMVTETITISDAVAAGAELDLNIAGSYISGTEASRSGSAIRVGLPQLRGTVVKADGTTPVQNAWIMVFDQSNWNFQPQGANTDSNGQFSLGGLEDGTYDIEVNMPWGQGLIAPTGLSVVVTNDVGVVKENGDTLLNNKIQLEVPSKTISGRVYKDSDSDGVYDTGEEVDNARVEVHKDMGGGFVETTTGSDGTYSLKVGGGSWWVEVRPDWGSDVDWTYNEMPTRVTFASDSTTETEEKNFIVSGTNATIYGYVKKADGTAVSNCWVDICQDMGMCNGRSTDSNGRFSVKASAGTYRVSAFPPHDLMNTFGAPDEKIITVAANQSADAGTLTLKAKNSHITGKVQDTAGNAVSNVVINVFQFNAPGWGMSFTDTAGAFDVTVATGTWGVMVMPMSNDYVYQGAPLSVTVADSETSSDNNFILQVADSTIKGKVRLGSATGAVVTDLWGGVWIKNNDSDDSDNFNNMLDFGGPMDDMMSKSGMMDSGTGGGAPMGGGMEQGGGTGINNGAFELKVPAGEYEIGLGTPPGSSYTLLSTETATILSDTDTNNNLGYTEVNLIVVENDATISGNFYIDANDNDTYDVGEETSGLRAMVNADKNGGGWQMTESNSDGSYSLSVSAGTWFVDAFLDVFMVFGFGANANQYMVISPDEKITIASEGATTLNFEVKSLDATITGNVTDDDGAGMSGVWVFANYGSAEMVEEFKGPGGPGIGAFTDADGDYSIKVTGGTYKIGVGVPPWDTRGLITPDFQIVEVASGATASGNDMQFKASDCTISGTVYLDADSDGVIDSGEEKASFVRAWSNSGQGNGVASTDGSYSISATQGDTWYLVAVKEIDNVLYESNKATIAVDSATETQNLALISKEITIPESKTVSFDSSESKTITLTNGLKLEMPAASIATSGTVTVSITPTVDVKPDSKEKPLGITYDFSARDADGVAISSLAGNVTITMPYNEALIEAAGYSEESITPKYFNTTTGTWENYDTVMRNTEDNILIIITDHFSFGGAVGEEVATAPTGLSASTASSSSISLSWTDNSDDETGFKVYRSSADSSWESASLITTTTSNAISYTNTGLSASTIYYYRVKASNASGDSSWSNTASAATSATVSTTTGGAVPLSFLNPVTTDDEETITSDEETIEETTTDEIITEETIAVEATTIEQAIQGLIMSQKSVSDMTADELKADIAIISSLITQLQVELNKLVSVPVIQGCSITSFDRNLKKGMTGEDVKCLQIILNSDVITKLADSGIGSANNETTYFGSLTKSAVIKFQEKYADEILASWGITTGTGYVGSTTIEKLNLLFGN